jgi:hypothetical protein
LGFVGGGEGVDEAVDFAFFFFCCCCWRSRGGDFLNDVCVAAFVDDPFVAGETGDAEVLRFWAAKRHLMEPEVRAVAKVEGGVLVWGGHFFFPPFGLVDLVIWESKREWCLDRERVQSSQSCVSFVLSCLEND